MLSKTQTGSMNLTDFSTRLAESAADLHPEIIAEKHSELRVRDVVLRIADEVNLVAREDLARAEHLANVAGWLGEAIDDDFCRARAARSKANTKVLRGCHAEAESAIMAPAALLNIEDLYWRANEVIILKD